MSLKTAVLVLVLGGSTLTPLSGQRQPNPDQLAQSFFRLPLISGVKISPSGTHVAALYAVEGKEMIVVRPVEGGNAVPIVTLPDPEARFRWLEWANETRILFSVEELAPRKTPPKSMRTRLYGIDRDGTNHDHLARNWRRNLFLGRGDIQFEDRIIDLLESDPKHLLISIRTHPDHASAYRMKVNDGGLERVVDPVESVWTWHADHSGVLRAGSGYQNKNWRLFARASQEKEFQEMATAGLFDDEALFFEGFSPDPNLIYVSTWSEGFTALFELDLSTRTLSERLFSQPGFDVPRWLELSDDGQTLLAAGYWGDKRERHFFDEAARQRQQKIDQRLSGVFNEIVSETLDRSRVIIEARGDTTPPTFYLYAPDEGSLTLIAVTLPDLADLRLSPTKSVTYKARDGKEIPGYLTLPSGIASNDLPLVMLPHQGPTGRDIWDWDPTVQFLAQLGFAVMQPNYRGSSGFGREYHKAGLQQWGLAMQDDVTDGVRWLVEQGIVDPTRVCIFGSGYGGYAALMGLIKNPDLYRCAASYAGPTDLLMLLNHDRGYMFSEINVPFIGSSIRDRRRLRETSPLENIETIRAPVLLGHGEDDERVHVSHSTKLAKALEKADKPVQLIVLENESHSFRAESGRIRFFAALGHFLLENTQPHNQTDVDPSLPD